MGNKRKKEDIFRGKGALVGIIMGSDSDIEVMKDAAEVLESFGIPYEFTIVSAHRTPDRMFEYAKSARERGIEVIIAGAGGAAHLPGMVASITHLPVIGVPIKTSSLGGFDSLLSIVQMPAGVPVATVAINNAKNAALLALRILSIKYPEIEQKIVDFMKRVNSEVKEKASLVEKIGFRKYLESMKLKK